jgi:cathepsin A (carboxypeptidase C)
MMGNGLTDPLTQYSQFRAMACEPSNYGTLIQSSEKCSQLDTDQQQCQKFIEKCYKHTNATQINDPQSKEDCVMAASVCNSFVVKPILDSLKVNMYDIRRPCEGKKKTQLL